VKLFLRSQGIEVRYHLAQSLRELPVMNLSSDAITFARKT